MLIVFIVLLLVNVISWKYAVSLCHPLLKSKSPFNLGCTK